MGCRQFGDNPSDYLRCPFFSSWERTEAAKRFASAAVGFLVPLRTLEASVEIRDDVCFFGITFTSQLRRQNVSVTLAVVDLTDAALINAETGGNVMLSQSVGQKCLNRSRHFR